MNIFGFEDLTPEGQRILGELEKLTKLEVAVGYTADQTYNDGTSLAEVAAYNELGSSTTPPRPFIKQTLEDKEDEIDAMKKDASQAVENGMSAENVLKEIGVKVKGIIQEGIVDGDWEPNAPSTIKRKGSSQPLIDTGHMRQSVNYVVRNRS